MSLKIRIVIIWVFSNNASLDYFLSGIIIILGGLTFTNPGMYWFWYGSMSLKIKIVII